MAKLTEPFLYLTEEEYTQKVLELFRQAVLNLTGEEIKMLLVLRQQTDQMLLVKRRKINKMINQRRVATVILAVCILLGSSTCTAKKENRALDELWEAAMVDAVFFEDDEVHELVTLTKQAPDVIWDEAGERVLLLSWHNYGDVCAPFRSTDLIAGTNGIDAVLDGHSHSVISCNIVENKDGEKVLLSSTGTGLTNIGQLVIAADGNLIAGLISNFPETDTETDDYVKWIQSQYEEKLNHVVAQIEVTLTTLLESGVRLICNRETNLGDFCADAYRVIADADIAFANGRGIRADINAGDVTYGDMIAVHPYGNTLCVVETTGQEILDALEMASRSTMAEVSDGENAMGENGGFLQVSGLKYTIDTSISSSVEVDAAGMFVSCGANRRVKDVQVLQADGGYLPIEPTKTYTLASHNYLIKQGGDGLNMFMDNTLTMDEGMLDYQVLITYITEHLGGTVGADYAEP